MITLFKLAFELFLFLLVFSAGIRFNQKWPNAASYLVWVWTTAETIIKWAFGLLKGLGKVTAPPSAK